MKCNTDISRVKVSYGTVSCAIKNEQKATERALKRAERLGKQNLYKVGDRLPEGSERSFHAEFYRDGKGKLRSERLVEVSCKPSTLSMLKEAGVDVSGIRSRHGKINGLESIRYVKAKSVKEDAEVFKSFKKLPEKANPACAKGARAGMSNQFDPDLQPISRGVAKISLPEVKESVLRGKAVSNRRMAVKFERSRFVHKMGWFPSAKEDQAVVNKMIQMKADGVVSDWSEFITLENPYNHKHYRDIWSKWCKYLS